MFRTQSRIHTQHIHTQTQRANELKFLFGKDTCIYIAWVILTFCCFFFLSLSSLVLLHWRNFKHQFQIYNHNIFKYVAVDAVVVVVCLFFALQSEASYPMERMNLMCMQIVTITINARFDIFTSIAHFPKHIHMLSTTAQNHMYIRIVENNNNLKYC